MTSTFSKVCARSFWRFDLTVVHVVKEGIAVGASTSGMSCRDQSAKSCQAACAHATTFELLLIGNASFGVRVAPRRRFSAPTQEKMTTSLEESARAPFAGASCTETTSHACATSTVPRNSPTI